MRPRLLAATAVVFASLCAGPGCGSGQPPLLGGSGPDSSSGADGGSSVPHFTLDSSAPPCSDTASEGVCGCLDLPLLTDPPNLYFVLDHSGSMNDSNKWVTVRISIGKLMTELGPRASFAAALFPDPAAESDSCAAGVEVSPLRRGDSPAGVQGPTTHALLTSIAIPAYGGTPTAATFATLTPHIASLHGKTFAILATDGGPNCDAAIECSSAQCTLNIEDTTGCPPDGTPDCCTPDQGGGLACLDGNATIAAVTELAARGVPTYVIGVPGSGPYAALLDRLAQVGGTARSAAPYYYPVDTTDQAAFYAALSLIAAKVTASCTLPLGMKPPDPSLVNVYFDEKVVPQAGPDGWTYADDTVTLLGTSCSAVLDGDVLDVRIVSGCPTIEK